MRSEHMQECYRYVSAPSSIGMSVTVTCVLSISAEGIIGVKVDCL